MTLVIASQVCLGACSTQRAVENYSENPVQNFESEKQRAKENPSGTYALDRKKFDAAMYLYSHAQTDLKSGNSAKAIGELALAREYNPWHDDIKDLYTIAVRHFVKITNELGDTADCQTMNNRLTFLGDTAPDYLFEVKQQIARCKFAPKKGAVALTESYISGIRVPDNAAGSMGSVDFELLGELDGVVKRNNYIPTRELLNLALEYISKVTINLGSPSVSPFSEDPNKFEIVLPVRFKNLPGMSGKEYCSATKQYLEMKESSDRIECRYWGYTWGYGEMKFNSRPGISLKIWDLWPLPKDVVVAFKLKYRNKPEVILRDVIRTEFKPDNVDSESGFFFDYVSGDLPVKQGIEDTNGHRQHWLIEKDGATIAIEADRPLINGLIGISAYIDLKATKDLYQ